MNLFTLPATRSTMQRSGGGRRARDDTAQRCPAARAPRHEAPGGLAALRAHVRPRGGLHAMQCSGLLGC